MNKGKKEVENNVAKLFPNNEFRILTKFNDLNSHVRIVHNSCKYEFHIKLKKIFKDGKNFKCPLCSGELKRNNEWFLGKINRFFPTKPFVIKGDFISMDTKIMISYNCGHCHLVKPFVLLNPKNKASIEKCPKCNGSHSSHNETNLYKFISKIYSGRIIQSEKTILENGKEIDIYLPDEKIGFEYDGLVFHGELTNKDKNCQLVKLEDCLRKKVKLVQIFSDEYNSDSTMRKICQVKIKHLLNVNDNKVINTRKCKITSLSRDEKNKFLELNHIRGKDNSTLNYALKYNEKIVAIITFTNYKQLKHTLELKRFAININYRVPGAFSKLWKHFLKHHEKTYEVISFVDRRWNNGDVFLKNGFQLQYIEKPTYWYVDNCRSIKRLNKRYFTKKKLKYLFPEKYDAQRTEANIMKKSGYFRIWDCGYLVFKYNNY